MSRADITALAKRLADSVKRLSVAGANPDTLWDWTMRMAEDAFADAVAPVEAESRALAQAKLVRVKPGDVIAYTGPVQVLEYERLERMGQWLNTRGMGPEKVMLLWLPDGTSLNDIPPDVMEFHGWVRKVS